jgi:hypothetical protein
VEQYEEESSIVCGMLSYLLADQSKTSKTSRDAQAFNYSRMKVGTHSYGFPHRFTQDNDRAGCSLGSSGSSNKVDTLLTHKNSL